jgi:hypothetical protein
MAVTGSFDFEFLPRPSRLFDGAALPRHRRLIVNFQSKNLACSWRRSTKIRNIDCTVWPNRQPTAREDRSNLLNRVLKDFSVTEMETREADFQLFCAVAQAAGSQGCAGSLAGGQWEPLRITLHLQNAKTYAILNAIVAQNGRAIWTVTASNLASFPQSSGLWYIYPLQEPFKSVVSERLIRMAQ